MTRKEAYVLIRQYNLKDEIKQQYGKEFILLRTEVLESIIEDYERKLRKQEEPSAPDTIETNSVYEAACLAFLSILDDNGILDDLLDKLE